MQIQSYLNSSAAVNVSSSVFVLLVGSNDLFFNPNLTAKTIVSQVVNATSLLIKANASAIVLGAPYSFGESPYVLSKACTNCSQATIDSFDDFGSDFLANVTLASEMLNNRTDILLRTSIMDLYTLVQDAFNEPQEYGFASNTTQTACYTGAYGEAPVTVCSDPSSYLWWDLVRASKTYADCRQYHGTSALHSYFAEVAGAAISNITGLSSAAL